MDEPNRRGSIPITLLIGEDMPTRLMRSFALVAVAVGAMSLALGSGGNAQSPGTVSPIKQKIQEWENDPVLKPYTVIPGAPPVGPTPGTGKALALVVGLNEVDDAVYGGGAPPLSGCLKDVETMSAILSARGFSVRALRNGEATRGRVVEE